MITTAVRKAGKERKPGSRAVRASDNPVELPDGMWDGISRIAYELWEQRGRRNGHALQDWLDAEEIVMEQIHEARE